VFHNFIQLKECEGMIKEIEDKLFKR
jgi:hypothetical protein